MAGCAAHRAYLVPAPTDTLTQSGHAAVADVQDVRVVVTPNAWNGDPSDLSEHVTPLKVRIENHGKRPIRLTYDDFNLQGPDGKLFADLPPSSIKGSEYVGENRPETQAQYLPTAFQKKGGAAPAPAPAPPSASPQPRTVVVVPDFDYDDFYYAPYWGYAYDGLSPWPYGWAPDWGYYNTWYPYMQKIKLPTQSMLRKGIPEGVIAPGGYVTGFLYFKRVDPKIPQVEFTAKLQDARTGQKFGTVAIPLLVKKS